MSNNKCQLDRFNFPELLPLNRVSIAEVVAGRGIIFREYVNATQRKLLVCDPARDQTQTDSLLYSSEPFLPDENVKFD